MARDCGCLCLLESILALIFPPLAVLIHSGCSCDLLLNLLLTLCGYIPGKTFFPRSHTRLLLGLWLWELRNKEFVYF